MKISPPLFGLAAALAAAVLWSVYSFCAFSLLIIAINLSGDLAYTNFGNFEWTHFLSRFGRFESGRGFDWLADCRILQLSKRKFRAKTSVINEDLMMIKNLDEKATRKLLKEQKLGHLGCVLESGEPYVVPVNYLFKDDEIYIHCLPGQKLDALRAK